MIPEEVIEPEFFLEGAVREIKVNAYERNAQAREACILHHGYVLPAGSISALSTARLQRDSSMCTTLSR